MNFKEHFEQTPDKTKVNFLEELLTLNPDLRNQFLDYINQTDKNAHEEAIADPLEYIYQESEALQSDLEMLDFENPDWEFYVPRHGGYIPEYEAITHMAEDMVEEVFEGFKGALLDYFQKGKIDEALFMYVGAYNACINADIPDECEAIYNHEEYFLEQLKEIEKSVLSQLEKAVFSDKKAITITDAIFKEYTKNHTGQEQYLVFFEAVLVKLCRKKEIAEQIENLMRQYQITNNTLPVLVMNVSTLKEDTEAWLHNGEKLLFRSKEVAKDVLEYYLNNNDKNAFVRIAKKIFFESKFKHDFSEYLYKHIDKEEETEFYKDILKDLIHRTQKTEYYKELSPLLQPEEKEKFINDFANQYNFYTALLEVENRHREILELLTQKDYLYNFTTIIQRITHVFPNESFQILQDECLKTATKERGRHAYQQIIEYLKLASEIPQKQNELNQLVDNLYNWKPRLPALREKLREAGLKQE
ncbi:MAG: hypothetical protein ACOC4B_03010 [Bacteroidota bacterium]